MNGLGTLLMYTINVLQVQYDSIHLKHSSIKKSNEHIVTISCFSQKFNTDNNQYHRIKAIIPVDLFPHAYVHHITLNRNDRCISSYYFWYQILIIRNSRISIVKQILLTSYVANVNSIFVISIGITRE